MDKDFMIMLAMVEVIFGGITIYYQRKIRHYSNSANKIALAIEKLMKNKKSV